MISWPFDSTLTVDGEGNPIYSRTYSADVLATILKTYFRNGVCMEVGTSFQVVESTGMKVTVSPGRALINGHHCYEDSSREMTITAANAGMDRIDTIVLRLDLGMDALAIDLFVLTGTAAGSPVAPTLTRNAQVWEIALADLLITHATSTIPQAKITDTRLDSTRCGVVASIIGDTDTSTYYAQIAADLLAFRTDRQASFDVWFASVQAVLGENAAGELLNLINYHAPQSFTALLDKDDWSASAPYTQTVAVTDLLSTDVPIVDITLNATAATAILEMEAYGYVGKIETADDEITVTCYETKPGVDLNIALKVVR